MQNPSSTIRRKKLNMPKSWKKMPAFTTRLFANFLQATASKTHNNFLGSCLILPSGRLRAVSYEPQAFINKSAARCGVTDFGWAHVSLNTFTGTENNLTPGPGGLKLTLYFLGSSLIRPWSGNGPRIFRSSFVHPSFILRFLTKDQRRINGGSTKEPWILLGSGVGKVRLWVGELWTASYELQAVCFKLSSTRALRAVGLRISDGPGAASILLQEQNTIWRQEPSRTESPNGPHYLPPGVLPTT